MAFPVPSPCPSLPPGGQASPDNDSVASQLCCSGLLGLSPHSFSPLTFQFSSLKIFENSIAFDIETTTNDRQAVRPCRIILIPSPPSLPLYLPIHHSIPLLMFSGSIIYSLFWPFWLSGGNGEETWPCGLWPVPAAMPPARPSPAHAWKGAGPGWPGWPSLELVWPGGRRPSTTYRALPLPVTVKLIIVIELRGGGMGGHLFIVILLTLLLTPSHQNMLTLHT